MMPWADDLLRPYGFRVPVEGDPFGPDPGEEIVLAEVVDDHLIDPPRLVRQYPAPEGPPADDLVAAEPAEILRRLRD